MAKAPLPFRLSGPMALRLIREIAADSSRVVITVHARKRMLQRHISRPQVLECLLKGQLSEGPALDIHGNWTCTLRWRHAGDYIRVAVAIKQDAASVRKVIVITVMHED